MPSDLRFRSPRSDSNRRPSDYESKRMSPAGASQSGSGCSRQRGRPSSAFLTCGVMAGGMTKRMTGPPTAGPGRQRLVRLQPATRVRVRSLRAEARGGHVGLCWRRSRKTRPSLARLPPLTRTRRPRASRCDPIDSGFLLGRSVRRMHRPAGSARTASSTAAHRAVCNCLFAIGRPSGPSACQRACQRRTALAVDLDCAAGRPALLSATSRRPRTPTWGPLQRGLEPIPVADRSRRPRPAVISTRDRHP
jgi:hypothetical protein